MDAKSGWTILLGAALVAGAAQAEEIKLFNGKDMSGWTYYLRDSDAKMADVWTVKDGVIHCTGKPAGYIRTKKEYSDYTLTLEWRWPEGPGNSGVLLHASKPDKVWPKSIEAQLHSGDAGDIWVIDGTTLDVPNAAERTKGRRTLNLTDDSEKPLGEWNSYEITCKGGDITLKVNGQLVNKGSNASVTKGYICLQSEGTPVEFRNIELTPLD